MKVYNLEEVIDVLKIRNINIVLIAISNISTIKRNIIIEKLEKNQLQVKIIPAMADLIEKKTFFNQYRDISVEDYLKKQNKTNSITIKNIKNKTVLVTGCGGSIGSELCFQILKIKPKFYFY